MRVGALNDHQRRRLARLYDQTRLLEDYLRDISAIESVEELHQTAFVGWRDDIRLICVNTVLNHPLCDFGTALQIYWRLEFSYATLRFVTGDEAKSPGQKLAFDEMILLEKRFAEDDFCSKQIAVECQELYKSLGIKRPVINRTIPAVLHQDSPGDPCPQDDLDISMSHQEWRDTIRKYLDSTAATMEELAEEDPEYRTYHEWFVRRNIDGDMTPVRVQSSRFGIRNIFKRFSPSARIMNYRGYAVRNRSLSDDQRRRLYRILETTLPVQVKKSLVNEMESTEELHHLAISWNWDDGEEVLQSVVDHPLCDHGTALFIYWAACPTYYCEKYADRTEVPRNSELQMFDFIEHVEARLLTGDFASARMPFDLSEWSRPQRSEKKTLKRNIPEKLIRDVEGKPFVRDSLHYELNSSDRRFKIFEEVSDCHYQIQRESWSNPMFKSIANRFADLNIADNDLRDPPVIS